MSIRNLVPAHVGCHPSVPISLSDPPMPPPVFTTNSTMSRDVFPIACRDAFPCLTWCVPKNVIRTLKASLPKGLQAFMISGRVRRRYSVTRIRCTFRPCACFAYPCHGMRCSCSGIYGDIRRAPGESANAGAIACFQRSGKIEGKG